MGTTSTEVDSPVSGLTTRMLRAIEWYQQQRTGALSPCRFFPSCSEYAHDAITLHGPWRGGWLAVRRLTRCRPFGPSGYDPVPDRQRHAHRTAHQPHAHETACCAHHSHHEETSNV